MYPPPDCVGECGRDLRVAGHDAGRCTDTAQDRRHACLAQDGEAHPARGRSLDAERARQDFEALRREVTSAGRGIARRGEVRDVATVVVARGDREEGVRTELVRVARLRRPIGVVLLEHDCAGFAHGYFAFVKEGDPAAVKKNTPAEETIMSAADTMFPSD